jgi:polar amino acid transport system permease protein
MLQAIADWFRWLYDATGINLTIFYEAFDRARFFAGVLTSLELSVVSMVGCILVGIIGAWLQGSNLRITKSVVHLFVAFFRNTPPLIQLYFFFFVIGEMLSHMKMGGGSNHVVTNFYWAVISLSFYFGSFNIEAFRAGIEAVPRATVEAAESLGYTRLQIYTHVVMPLAIRISLPALTNNLVGLVKGTSLAYCIAVPEVLYVSSQIWADELNVAEMMNVLLIFYIVVVGLVVYAMKKLEHTLRMPGYHRVP